MSFDAWEASIRPSSDSLMHFGIPGMKHGRRRYQNEDGTWTSAGLEARRKREGFGKRHQARKEARKAARAEKIAKRQANNVKYMSDEEIQKRINRLKLEKEYKDLKKNPAIELGKSLVKAYLESKDKKEKREMDKANLIIRDRESRAKLINAKAAKINAKNDVLDNVARGKGYMKAKKELIDSKADKTVGGAIKKAINGIITKEGRAIVNEMPDHSLIVSGARKTKNAVKKSNEFVKNVAKTAYAGAGDAYLNHVINKNNKKSKKKKNLGSDYKG